MVSIAKFPKRNGHHVPFSLRGGSLVALPTPFRDDKVDEEAVAALCTRQINAGTNAIVVCATTGEAPSLNYGDQRRVIEVAVEAAQDKVPIIAGAGTCSTASSVALAHQADRAGAAALLCVVPYYVRPTQEGIYQHMRAIHDAVRVPLILYDVPARTGCALADETVVRLSQLERVIGLKDAAGNPARPMYLRSRVKADFLLLSGDDVTQDQYRRSGGDGCISVTANIAPALCAEMHNAWDCGDHFLFDKIAGLLEPLSRMLFIESNPTPVKYALCRMRLLANELRLPLVPLSQAHEDSVQAAVEAVLAAELKMHTAEILPFDMGARKRTRLCHAQPR